nr:MAG TPA: hypothetical protein [Caudoviricetes sp.]
MCEISLTAAGNCVIILSQGLPLCLRSFHRLTKGGEMMAKNSVRTSKSVASKASKALSSGKTSKSTKSLAASALSNRRSK